MSTLVERPLRDALRMIAPGPVTLISTMFQGQPNLMTAGWISAQSLNPTMLSVAVHPERLTHQFMNQSEQFVVNVPVLDLLSIVHKAGLISGRDGDKFAALGIEPVESSTVDAPRVDGCAGYIECEVRDRFQAGDHDLFVAEVVYVAADDESFNGFWDVSAEAGRLLHHLGADRYAGLGYPYQATSSDDEEEEE